MKIINLLCILSIIFTSACSTSSKRTEDYPPQFYDYTPTEQSLIRRGRIAVDFDESQVRMAWGNPTRILNADSSNNSYHWEYKKLETRQNVLKYLGNALSRGADPVIIARQDPFYDKLAKRVVFDMRTRKVLSFNSY
jgi:hypothetical protein